MRLAPLLIFAAGALLVADVLATTPAASAPPAVAREGAGAAGAFVWHDLVTHDRAQSQTFYGGLFAWTFERSAGVDPDYVLIKDNGRPIGGIVTRTPNAEAESAQWLTYVAVADVDQVTMAFQQAGGRVFRGPLNVRRDLRVAVVADAQGAALGLASRGPDLPEETGVPQLHRWLWMEYVARDAAAALQFYGDALGYSHELYETRADSAYYLLTSGRPRAGLFRSPWPRDTSAWLPYVRVAEPAAMAERAAALGGTVVLSPRSDIRNGSLAIILDPTGAALALQRFPFRDGAEP